MNPKAPKKPTHRLTHHIPEDETFLDSRAHQQAHTLDFLKEISGRSYRWFFLIWLLLLATFMLIPNEWVIDFRFWLRSGFEKWLPQLHLLSTPISVLALGLFLSSFRAKALPAIFFGIITTLGIAFIIQFASTQLSDFILNEPTTSAPQSNPSLSFSLLFFFWGVTWLHWGRKALIPLLALLYLLFALIFAIPYNTWPEGVFSSALIGWFTATLTYMLYTHFPMGAILLFSRIYMGLCFSAAIAILSSNFLHWGSDIPLIQVALALLILIRGFVLLKESFPRIPKFIR